MEKWAKIEGYKPIYYVSNYGRVKSIERVTMCNTGKGVRKERILKCGDRKGYKDVYLFDENGKRHQKLVHRLVAQAFIENPNNLPEIDHIDANKANNKVTNLKWVTHKENCNNPLTYKKYFGRKSARAKKIVCYFANGEFKAEYENMTIAAKQNKVYRENISKCCRGIYKTTGGLIFKYV